MVNWPLVLLVIRNPELRQLYHEILVAEHWEVLVAGNAADGLLQLVSHDQIAIVVLDMGRPNGEAERFLRMLKSRRKWRKTPLVLLDFYESALKKQQLIKGLGKWVKIDSHLIAPDMLVSQIKRML